MIFFICFLVNKIKHNSSTNGKMELDLSASGQKKNVPAGKLIYVTLVL